MFLNKKIIIAAIGTFLSMNASSQYDSRNFTYDESSKNYINYEQLEELTNKFLLKDKSIADDETLRQQIYIDKSELPFYTDEEMHKKILAIPSTIPMKYHPEVGRIIRYFLFEKRDYMTRMLTLSKIYFPIFEEVLDEQNLPIELKYLAIVESALNPQARSRVGATGLWQFMHGTAKHEGMEINSLVDERSDIYKSTEHAAIYLKKLYNIYGDWLLALAAYNSGPGNVNKAIKQSGGYDFWTIKHRLPRETQNYVPSFIAITYAMHYAKEYKLQPGKPQLNLSTCKTEKVFEKQSLKYIAELLGCSEDYLAKYNPSLKKGIIPKVETGFPLHLPRETALTFNEKRHLFHLDPYIYNPSFTAPVNREEVTYADNTSTETPQESNVITYTKPVAEKKMTLSEIASSISKKDPRTFASTPTDNINSTTDIEPNNYQSTVSKPTTSPSLKVVKVVDYQRKSIYHAVKKGENLTAIARNYDVSVADIKSWNHLDIHDNLFVGKKLKIEQMTKVVKPQYVANDFESNSSAKAVTDNVIVHKIRKGETLLQLTRLYNCSIEDLKEWNQLSANEVKVDQEIFVYVEHQAPKIRSYSYYEAKPGDTLVTASIQFNIPIEVLKSLNNKGENEPLKKGEKIKIPTL